MPTYPWWPTMISEVRAKGTTPRAPAAWLAPDLHRRHRHSQPERVEKRAREPPAYDPQPRSWRAAAARLRVEEGKVRADHRRVAQKVAAAGGPDGGGSRYRDALIGWLLARGVVIRDDVELVV